MKKKTYATFYGQEGEILKREVHTHNPRKISYPRETLYFFLYDVPLSPFGVEGVPELPICIVTPHCPTSSFGEFLIHLSERKWEGSPALFSQYQRSPEQRVARLDGAALSCHPRAICRTAEACFILLRKDDVVLRSP